jgi:hypothetical protein
MSPLVIASNYCASYISNMKSTWWTEVVKLEKETVEALAKPSQRHEILCLIS